MRHVDLCSGIGGFALGLEWSGLSYPVLFCDSDEWCRSVLTKHWPNVPIANDVKELALDPTKLVPDCEILTAGYPCQPFSVAGHRAGSKDNRHIWPEIFSIIQAKRPAWIILENVSGHVTLGLDAVLTDLEGESYAARPFLIPACAADAPHRRDRVFIIARDVANSKSIISDVSYAFKKTSNKSRKIWKPRRGNVTNDVANSKSERVEGYRTTWQQESQLPSEERLLGCDSARRMPSLWPPESRLGRVVDGVSTRLDRHRLKGLGNAVVPQIIQRIGETIKAVNHEGKTYDQDKTISPL